MTCQEISALARYHYHPIIIVLNNNGYTTERGLDKDIKRANDIRSWDYKRLIELVGSGRYIGNIKTEKELDTVLCHCFDMDATLASWRNNSKNRNRSYSQGKEDKGKRKDGLYSPTNDKDNNDGTKRNDDGHHSMDDSESEEDKNFEGKENDSTHEYSYDDENEDEMENENEDDPKDDLTDIVDLVYCKEKGRFYSFSDSILKEIEKEENYNRAKYSGVKDDDSDSNGGDIDYDYDYDYIKDNEVKGGGKTVKNIEMKKKYYGKNQNQKKYKLRDEDRKRILSKLAKKNYLTLIELQLDPFGMSYGTHRFITLSQKKK